MDGSNIMGEEDTYNAKLCDERHRFIAEELRGLSAKITGFYILAIATLAGVIANFLKA
jgi:hypothetical protein